MKKFAFMEASSSSSSSDDDEELAVGSSDAIRSHDNTIVIQQGANEEVAVVTVSDSSVDVSVLSPHAVKPVVDAEGATRQSLTSRIATGIFGAVERLMFGTTTDESANNHNPDAQLSGSSVLTGPQGGLPRSHNQFDVNQRTPSSVTTVSRDVVVRAVAIEDPQIAWAKRHARRLHQRTRAHSFHPPTEQHHAIARFSNAIAGHHQFDYDDEDPRTHSHSAIASARGHTGRRAGAGGDPYYLPDDDAFGGFASSRGGTGVLTLPPGSSIAVELVSALEAYQGAPNEYYGSIVQAALAERGPEDPIIGEELRWAARNPYLMQLILGSGALDVNDLEVQIIVQREIESTIRARDRNSVLIHGHRQPVDERKHLPRLDPSVAGYLKMLFLLPTSRINAEQVALMEDSGFEFVKLLHDNPHIMRDIPKPPWWQLTPYEEHRHFDLMASLLGMVLILMDLTSMIAIAIHWWQTRTNFGYWTILLACGGWIATLIVVVVFENTKVDSSFYDERLAEFPSSNGKLVPIIPSLEAILVFNIVRYYIAARREKRAFFVVTHDLHANFAVLFILHSQCHSFPQLLLQNYLFVWGSFNEADYFFFHLLVVTTSISCCSSLLLFIRRIACFRSVNGAGFSVFGAEGTEANFDSRSEFFPKVITFILIYVLEYNVFFLIVAVMNVSTCSTTVLVWIGIIGLIILAVVVILIFSLAKGKSSSTTGKLALGPLVAQIAFAIYGSVFSNNTKASGGTNDQASTCAFYSFTLGANVRVGIAAFSLMLSVWVIWILVTIWRRYGTMDKRIPLGAKLRWLLLSHNKHDAITPPPKVGHHGPEEDNQESPIEGVVPAPLTAGDSIDAVQIENSNRAYSTDPSVPLTPEVSAFQSRSNNIQQQPTIVG